MDTRDTSLCRGRSRHEERGRVETPTCFVFRSQEGQRNRSNPALSLILLSCSFSALLSGCERGQYVPKLLTAPPPTTRLLQFDVQRRSNGGRGVGAYKRITPRIPLRRIGTPSTGWLRNVLVSMVDRPPKWDVGQWGLGTLTQRWPAVPSPKSWCLPRRWCGAGRPRRGLGKNWPIGRS